MSASRSDVGRGLAPRPERWTRGERALLASLSSPSRVQDYLDRLTYRAEERAACPRRVIEEQRAHCFDGALFAAAALRQLGHPPRLLDLRAVRDDDHVLSIFRANGHWGALAKSNFVGLRFREPVYRTLRELVLSYFDDYFNADGERTLREHSGPLSLAQFDRLAWTFRDEPLPMISERLDALQHRRLLTRKMERELSRVDPRSLEAGMLGTLRDALYGKH